MRILDRGFLPILITHLAFRPYVHVYFPRPASRAGPCSEQGPEGFGRRPVPTQDESDILGGYGNPETDDRDDGAFASYLEDAVEVADVHVDLAMVAERPDDLSEVVESAFDVGAHASTGLFWVVCHDSRSGCSSVGK